MRNISTSAGEDVCGEKETQYIRTTVYLRACFIRLGTHVFDRYPLSKLPLSATVHAQPLAITLLYSHRYLFICSSHRRANGAATENIMEISLKRLFKPLVELQNDPAIPLPGIYPKQTNTLYQRDACYTTCMEVLSTIAKMWINQSVHHHLNG